MKRRIVCTFLIMALLSLGLCPASAHALDALKNTDPDRYYILLDCNNQIVTVYERDEAGAYTRIVRRMLCTTGRTEVDETDPEDVATPTPNGVWKIGARERFGKFASFSNEYARYWTQVVDGIYFHSIMFSRRETDSLKSNPYKVLGQKASHGCIRLYVEDAKWLYYNACPGTTVRVSYGEKSNWELAQSLRAQMSFREYNAFQQNIYDEEPLPDRTAWITVDGATLRTGNGSNDKVIKRLEAGTEITVLQEGDPWIKAQVGNREGYVKRAYISYQHGVMESVEGGPTLRSTAYLYESPDRKSSRICKVPHDTTLHILELDEEGGWAKIQYFTEVGYIEARYIRYDWATLYQPGDPFGPLPTGAANPIGEEIS